MTRTSLAYREFAARTVEVDALSKMAGKLERSSPPGNREISYLCRGAVVLLSAHLEAYLKELAEEAIFSLYQNGVRREKIEKKSLFYFSQEHINNIRDTKDPEKLASQVLDFIEADLVHWSRNGVVDHELPFEMFCKGFSNPKFEKIKSFVGRLGYSSLQADLKKRLKAKYQPLVTMLDALVDLRNKIAHGDNLASRTPAEVKELSTTAKRFAYHLDLSFSKWWKQTYCKLH